MIRINRCVCFDCTFSEIRALSEETGEKTIEELQRHLEFGMNCRLCHPYIRRMLRTGETTFNQILTEEDEPE